MNEIEVIDLNSNDSNSNRPVSAIQQKPSIDILFDSECEEEPTSSTVRLRNIFSDELPNQVQAKTPIKCLVDETLLSSDSCSSKETLENSNILDQNVLDLDDTCLDESQLQEDDENDEEVIVLEAKRQSVGVKRKSVVIVDGAEISVGCSSGPDEKKMRISEDGGDAGEEREDIEEVGDDGVMDTNDDQIIGGWDDRF